jgi:hypothetical protein
VNRVNEARDRVRERIYQIKEARKNAKIEAEIRRADEALRAFTRSMEKIGNLAQEKQKKQIQLGLLGRLNQVYQQYLTL